MISSSLYTVVLLQSEDMGNATFINTDSLVRIPYHIKFSLKSESYCKCDGVNSKHWVYCWWTNIDGNIYLFIMIWWWYDYDGRIGSVYDVILP